MKSVRPQKIIQSGFNVDFSVPDTFLCPLDLQLLCIMNLYPNMPCPSIEDFQFQRSLGFQALL
jgi:hypothetical protein